MVCTLGKGDVLNRSREKWSSRQSLESFLWVRKAIGGSESLISKTRLQRFALPRAGGAF